MTAMKHRRSALMIRTGIALSAITLSAMAVEMDTEENPYQLIVERNPFNLKPIPVVDTSATQSNVAANITFTGLTTLGDVKRAYFMDSKKNPPILYSLGEGEQQDVLKVVKIDEKQGAVDIVNAGTATRVTFESHGNKTIVAGVAAAPVPSGMPGAVPGSPAGVAPRAAPNPNSPNIVVPSPAASGNPGTAAVNPTIVTPRENTRLIPTRSVRVQPATATPAPAVNPAAQEALMMINKEMNRAAEERGEMPPLPVPTAQ